VSDSRVRRAEARPGGAARAAAAADGRARDVQVRGEERGVSDQYGVRDAACPLSTRGGRAREVQVLDLERPADRLQLQARLVFRVQLARHLQSARGAQAEAASRGAMRRQLRTPDGWRAQGWGLRLAVDRVENAVCRAAPFSRAGVLFTSIRGECYSHE
jgi:hypothetical protein